MPTITELPIATAVDPSDEVPVSQGGNTRTVSVGSLLASTQPAIMAPTGVLLGRVSVGAGGPEPIAVGTGLELAASAVQANGGDHASFPPQTTLLTTDEAVLNSNGMPMLLPLSMLRGLFSAGENVTISASGVISSAGSGTEASGNADSIAGLSQVDALAATDLVAVSQNGVDHAISYANLIDGETIDEFGAAAPAADTDTLPVGQGSSTMLAQTFGAVWTWMQGKLPLYRLPVVEISANTTIDGSVHNGRILVCSSPVTLTHSGTEGSGFVCSIINASSGTVSLDSGITTTSGVNTLSPGQMADIYCVTYSAGTFTYAWTSGPVAAPVPGQVLGVSVGAVTYSSVALSWSAPVAGGTPSTYIVQYRVTGTSAWTMQSAAVTNTLVFGLSAATEYDFQVIAANAGGNGTASSLVQATTPAAPTLVPGQVTGLTTSAPSNAAITLSWLAPTSGGAVASYTAQYRATGQSGWITAGTGIVSLGFIVTGLTASTEYDFQVYGVNSAGNGSPSSIANGTTTIAAPGTPSGLVTGSVTQTTAPMSWTTPSSGGAVATYTLQYRVTGATSWIQVTGLTSASYTITGLTASTSYDVQVAAVNAGGSSAFTVTTTALTLVSAPGLPGTPTAAAASASTNTTQSLTWAAPTSGGTVATYNVRYGAHPASSWTTLSGITGTSTTVAGLAAGSSYDYQVEAVNAGGNSGWTATTTATTASYDLTYTAPAAGYTAAHGTNGIIAQVSDNAISSLGSHTSPSLVYLAWSTSNTVQPTTGLQSTTYYNGTQASLWVTYANGPTSAGTYYLWGIAYNSVGTQVASCVGPGLVFT